MRRALAFACLLTSCAAAPPAPEVFPNEQARRDWYPGRWSFVCRDLRAGYGEAPFLRFKMLEENRIVELKFLFGPGPRYGEHAIPGDKYGPFKGEEVTDESSTYFGANDYKITDTFHLYLPYLREGFEHATLGRDRDSSRQNAAAETAVNGQRYLSILHLRCVRE